MEIDVPVSVAYKCYSDREAIPNWMPFISSVKVLEDKPDLSRWSLKYKAFGRDLEFSWLARNMQPIPNQKIHWRSLEGLPNRGAVRFYPKGPSSCLVELTVSYEVPQLLTPVASALTPFLENLLSRGLDRFARYAKSSAETTVFNTCATIATSRKDCHSTSCDVSNDSFVGRPYENFLVYTMAIPSVMKLKATD
ncbi:putative cyclase/dehydrase protein [Corchorus capsularis]|uniref:Putative cyclase/dehydrase protein n=1 Tax=Corchorus capsularis TaxID=210143 RepID=A0A1R3H138_COCAP|nr:putative cyclase/dehydrase protein [Corchorus capsularis]